ncbi:hypothetical protein TNCV_3915581 [Trichonephila clavipes]|nr:hypothetical protein TNCV_3915581 [Trichonephila clavipes]
MNIPRRPIGFRESFPLTLCLKTLNFPEKKSAALWAYALETIMTLYPKDMGLHIYTDGSAKDDGPVAADFLLSKHFEGSLAAGLSVLQTLM